VFCFRHDTHLVGHTEIWDIGCVVKQYKKGPDKTGFSHEGRHIYPLFSQTYLHFTIEYHLSKVSPVSAILDHPDSNSRFEPPTKKMRIKGR
jgi:hypothetical protein